VKHNSEFEWVGPQNSFSFTPGFRPAARDSHC
jgi:hypothetical protein